MCNIGQSPGVKPAALPVNEGIDDIEPDIMPGMGVFLTDIA